MRGVSSNSSVSRRSSEVDASTPSAFIPNKIYSVSIGANNVGGKATITKRNGVYHLEVPLQICGATLFAVAKPEQAIQNGFSNVDSTFFQAGAQSFDDIPALKRRILTMLKGIEKVFATPRCKLVIRPYFPRDADLTGSVHNELTNLCDGLKQGANDVMGIVIDPVPSPYRAAPMIWDAYSSPLIYAHELCHVFGVNTEGYLLDDYPIDGVMNDETANIFATKHGLEPRLLESDFNAIMRALMTWQGAGEPDMADAGLAEFTPAHELYQRKTRANWWGMTSPQRTELLRARFDAASGKPQALSEYYSDRGIELGDSA
jgi:hypothetical protein